MTRSKLCVQPSLSSPTLGLPGPGLGSTSSGSGRDAPPNPPCRLASALSPGPRPCPGPNDCLRQLSPSACLCPSLLGASCPSQEAVSTPSLCLTPTPKAGSIVSPFPSPSGKQGVGKGEREEGIDFMKKRIRKAILYFLETLRSISTGVLCKMRGLQRKNRHWSPLILFFFFLIYWAALGLRCSR